MGRVKLLCACAGVSLLVCVQVLVPATDASAAALTDAFTVPLEAQTLYGDLWTEGQLELYGEWETSPKWVGKTLSASADVLRGVSYAGERCSSPGQPPGVVRSEPITLELGWISYLRKEVGLRERPTSGELYAQFTCGPHSIEINGSLIGLLTPIHTTVRPGSQLTYDVAVNRKTGQQGYFAFEGGPFGVMEDRIDGGPYHEVAIEELGALKPTSGTIRVRGRTIRGLRFEILTRPS